MDEKLRLRHQRLRKGIDLETIAAATALSPVFVAAIDEGRFEDLPPGVYARAYVRAFAGAVGVPADDALRGIEDLLPRVEDPLPALRELAPPSPGESIRDFFATQAVPLSGVVAKLTPRRAAASIVDAVLLLAIGALMVGLASWATGADVRVLLDEAGAGLALMFAIPVFLYFVLLDTIAHQTIGAAICGTGRRTGIVFRIPTFSPRPPRTVQPACR